MDGILLGGIIENGRLCLERLETNGPDGADELVLDLYRRLPDVRITDLMLEVDAATGITGAFMHLRTGAPCKDRIGLLNVLLAEGLNLGLSKMAEASCIHDYLQLSRPSRWHVDSEAIERALTIPIEAESRLPMAQFRGAARSASSDGQFFPTTRQGEIRDRTTEGQHFRIAGLNLHAAIIIYWNTDHLGHAGAWRRRSGFSKPEDLLAHIYPLDGLMSFSQVNTDGANWSPKNLDVLSCTHPEQTRSSPPCEP